jgi:hypothetical protein
MKHVPGKHRGLILLVAASLTGCAKHPQNGMEGTWYEFNDNYGLIEKTFQNDVIVIERSYGCGGNPDWEEKNYYTIIDNILFIGAEAYNYSIIENKLFLSRGDNSRIYTKKENDISVAEQKKLLIGQWKDMAPLWMEEDSIDHRREMEFLENDLVVVREYNTRKYSIAEGTYPYEITDKYIIIKDMERENKFSEFMNEYILDKGIYLYKLNSDSLILKIFFPESGLFIEMLLKKE